MFHTQVLSNIQVTNDLHATQIVANQKMGAGEACKYLFETSSIVVAELTKMVQEKKTSLYFYLRR